MQRTTRRWTTAAAMIAAIGGLAGAGSAAQAAGEQSAKADVTTGPFQLKFDAKRAAGTKSTQAVGTFEAEGRLGGFSFMQLSGPVTCLDVRGNKVGLFYPVDKSNPSLFATLGTGVYIYVSLDGKGKATGALFMPTFDRRPVGCRPLPTLLPATGTGTSQGS